MRILIAEDELLERKAMKKFIDENLTGFAVVGEAENGRKAIELAATTQPDIIFMDIKMPGINGLEAIEQIYAKAPDMRFVLVTAYDSFDYAKEAMRFGIRDYILKPGKKEEIVKTLLRLQKEINQEHVDKKRMFELQKERFLTNLMEQPRSEEVLVLQRELYPEMKSGCFLVIKSGNPEVKNRLEAVKHYSYMVRQMEDVIVVCMIGFHKLEKAELLQLARKLLVSLGTSTYIGISFPTESLKQLGNAYQEAYGACIQLASEKKANYGFKQTDEKRKNSDNMVDKISRLVEEAQATEAIATYKKYASQLLTNEKEDLYLIIKNLLVSRNINAPENTFSSLNTPADWQAYLHLCCMKMSDYCQSKQYMSQAKQYIHGHYQEQITLEKMAEIVQLSPNYFSNLFKQEFGETFIDYLTAVRLQQAKVLLEKNKHSLKEISYLVGYKDPNYFSRVFKKHFQQSPKRFQQSIFKK